MLEPFTLGVGSAALVGAGAGSVFTGILWYLSSRRGVRLLESTKRLTFSELASRSNPLRETSSQHNDSAKLETSHLIESRLKNRTTKERKEPSLSSKATKSSSQVYEAILSFTLLHKGLYFQLVNLWEKIGKLYVQITDSKEEEGGITTTDTILDLLGRIQLCVDLLMLLLEAERTEIFPVVAKLEFRKRPCWRKLCRKPLVELSATLLDEVETSTESVYAAVADLRNTISVAKQVIQSLNNEENSCSGVAVSQENESFVAIENLTCQHTLMLRLLDLRLLVLTSKTTEQFLSTEGTYYRFLGKYCNQEFLALLEGRVLSQLSRLPRGPGRLLSWALTTANSNERIAYLKTQHDRLEQGEFLALIDLLAAELPKVVWDQIDMALQEASIWSINA
ncbi:hypothetical protein GpartN1_g1236.t1 [Galdieria partita]|uniref:Uncharacterized protein n=1 Tax=Galdieria partita TaxID=83374 RepID=A0A9C7UNF1_9RHOD|nr:hypothetical protein GpartN1_g1236.t1 [Galdieria partita]